MARYTLFSGRDFEAWFFLANCGCVFVICNHRFDDVPHVIRACGRTPYENLVRASSAVKNLTAMDIAAIALCLGVEVPQDVEATIPRMHRILRMIGHPSPSDAVCDRQPHAVLAVGA